MPAKSTSSPDKTNRYSAPALEKGLDILEVLAEASLPLSQVEIAQRLNRTPGEFYRMLACLEERGFVIREAESGRFKLTLRLYELGHKQNATSLLRNAARLPMEVLAEEIGQACHLSVQYGTSILILMERMPPRQICLTVGEGTVMPLVDTITGKLLLSQHSDEDIHEILKDDPYYLAKGPKERKSWMEIIQSARTNGYAFTESGLTAGVADVATLVGVKGTDAEGVLVISFLSHLKETKDKAYLAALMKCAGAINQNLGVRIAEKRA